MIMTETHLLSLEGGSASERLALRRAYLTGRAVRSPLIRPNRAVRVVDYAETYLDGRYEIAVQVAGLASDGAAFPESTVRPRE